MSIAQFLAVSLTIYLRTFEYSSSVGAAKQSESLIHRCSTTVTRLVNSSTPTTLSVCIFLLTALMMLAYRPFSQAESGDSAFYDYFAQLILRGQVPYRDAIDIKAPGSFYLSALAMAAGRALGVRDIIAARLLHIFMASLLSVVVYLVGEAYFRNRFAALLAVSTLMISQHFGLWTVGGGQPKLPMILFGMLALLLTARNQPFLAGLCSMISCLCWQPGLLFTGVAFLIFSRYLTTWRDLRALRVLAGAVIPLALVVVYFGMRGALGDLWNWTIVFNYSVYSRKAFESETSPMRHMMSVVFKIYRTDIVLVAIGLAGFAVFTAQRLRERLGRIRDSHDLYRDAIVIAPLVYFAACLIRFNAGPYLIPFLPFVGLFFGWSVVEFSGIVNKRWPLASATDTKTASLSLLLVILFLGVAVYRAIAYQFESIQTLQEQDKTFQAVGRLLSASDPIYVHGTTELLVLLDKPNLNPYVFMDFGKDDYIAVRKYGGSFPSLVDEIEAQAPKIVALSRLQRVSHRNELKEWAETHYVSLGLPGYEEISIRRSELQPGKPANDALQ
jgi:hypothetical protein